MAIVYFTRRARKLRYYDDVYTLIRVSRRTRRWCLKCVEVLLALDIPPFVMYCVNGKPPSSLLFYRVYRLYDKLFEALKLIRIIESVDSISKDERGFPLTQYITNG